MQSIVLKTRWAKRKKKKNVIFLNISSYFILQILVLSLQKVVYLALDLNI